MQQYPTTDELISVAKKYFNDAGLESEAVQSKLCSNLPSFSRFIRQLTLPGKDNYRCFMKGSACPYDIHLYTYKDLEYIKISTVVINSEVCFYVIPKGSILKAFIYNKNVDLSKLQENFSDEPVLDQTILTEIKNLIEPLFGASAKQFHKYDCFVKRGILLHGPPGNGKSMLCDHIAGMTQFVLSADYFVGQFIDNDFESCLNYLSLAIFDDIDMNLFDRKSGPLVSQFLSVLDKSAQTRNQIRIFTTNESIDNIDQAFLRPGRIDKVIRLDLPNEDLRTKYIEKWHEDIITNVDFDKIINASHGWSFAQLQSLKTSLVNRFIIEGKWNLEDSLQDIQLDIKVKSKKTRKAGF